MRGRYEQMRRSLIEFAALVLSHTGKAVDPGFMQAIAYCDAQIAALDIAEAVKDNMA